MRKTLNWGRETPPSCTITDHNLLMFRLLQLFRISVLLIPVLLLPTAAAHAAPVQEEGAEAHEHFDPVHHVADGYYLDFEPFGKLELPRIFLVRKSDGGFGLDVFGSTRSAVRSGRYVAVASEDGHAPESASGGSEVTHEEAVVGTTAQRGEELIIEGAHLESLLQPVEGRILIDFSITRHLVFAVLAALIVLTIFLSLARRYKRGIGRETAPRGLFQNLFELLIVFVRDEIAKPTIGAKYERFLPYLLTVFFFIFTANLLGLVPFGATATSNLMITAVLALFTFFITQFSASRDHWQHIVGAGMPWFVRPILFPVEVLGLFTKPFALAIRLFANMTAGHLIILSLIGLIFSFTQIFGPGAGYLVSPVSVGFSLFIYLLELLVATIQAYIFTMLSALFIGMAAAEHHHEEHGAADHSEVTPSIPGTELGVMTPVQTEPVV